MGIYANTGVYRSIQWVYIQIQGCTGVYMGVQVIGIQGFTGVYMGVHEDTGVYRRVQGCI